jgi:hypothetical protein
MRISVLLASAIAALPVSVSLMLLLLAQVFVAP